MNRPAYNGRAIDVIVKSFPPAIQGKVKGAATIDGNRYIVMVDGSRTAQEQRLTIGHELAHIYLGHLDDPGGDVAGMEAQAAALAPRYATQYERGQLPGLMP